MIYFNLKYIYFNIISMSNIEKYVEKFEEAYEKASKQLMNMDKETLNFDNLNDYEKLFLF